MSIQIFVSSWEVLLWVLVAMVLVAAGLLSLLLFCSYSFVAEITTHLVVN